MTIIVSEPSLLVVQMESPVYTFVYIVHPTPLAPGWPRATRKRRRPDRPSESAFSACIRSGSSGLLPGLVLVSEPQCAAFF